MNIPLRVLVLAQYYAPEEIGPAIWIRQLCETLQQSGHEVTVLTSFPSYPDCVVFPEYRRRVVMRERINNVDVIRCWSHARGRGFVDRALGFITFCVSALLVGLVRSPRVDTVYTIIPPLPLGIIGWVLARSRAAAHVLNVQDIHPRAAIALGLLRNRYLVRFLEALERAVYAASDRIVVIAESFRLDLGRKGVPLSRIDVIPNWADSAALPLLPRDNGWRCGLRRPSAFVVLYSGGLTLNSCVHVLIEAAALLQKDDIHFVIVGDGPRKQMLQTRARELSVENIEFWPFQPIERYAEVLAAADLTVATLISEATDVSVPSKAYKQMAAGRPILAIAELESELASIVTSASCGFAIAPNNPAAVAHQLRWAAAHPAELSAMGTRARDYLTKHHDRVGSVARVAAVLAHRSEPVAARTQRAAG